MNYKQGTKALPTWDYNKGLEPIVTPKKAAPVVNPAPTKKPFGEDVLPNNSKQVTAGSSAKLQGANKVPGRLQTNGKFKKLIGQ